MKTLTITSYLMFIVSISGIIYALVANPPAWIVYAIAILFIPLSILSFGLLIMAHSKKEEEDERAREPFIGY
jgi:energy-converting hydrogenase A subunit I